MDSIYSKLRVEFLDYLEDNWKLDFVKVQKLWLKNRRTGKYMFDSNFTCYLRIVKHYGYCEWDPPQRIYDLAMDILAREVVYNIQPIVDYPIKSRK